jgi:GTPase
METINLDLISQEYLISNSKIYIIKKAPDFSEAFRCSGGPTRTDDLRVMSPMSYQLLYPAIYCLLIVSRLKECKYNILFLCIPNFYEKIMHKSGFVNIIGNPNVGKSTLMNALVGERLSIITSKAQTTRHRILGIVNDDDHQIVFSDTPGVLEPAYKMQESMMTFVKSALTDADVILFMVEVKENKFKDENILNSLKKTDIPIILLINKIDEVDQAFLESKVAFWKAEIPKAEIYPLSALHNFNIENIFARIKELLPEGEPFYDKDALTDKPEKFFVSEIIREKILLNYKKEVPYSCEVIIEEFKEKEDIIHIRANIIVARDSQKGILIGHQGKELKKVGTLARKDIETFFAKKVFLELYVKVNKDWRNDDNMLKRFGYNH